MFKINLAENRIERIVQRRFSELNLRERSHLQEWLANLPNALGEELLVIQKEFDGFEETKERLDLLALDKDGHLVLIENKLDDSGRDVVWQAIKYAAYVSNLTKVQIVDIFQKYLDRYCNGGNASEQICEFLEEEDLEEVVLNQGNSQRIVLIAANFRKEVTATALWLLNHGIQAKCFKVTPYSLGAELLLDVQQIIPIPEAAEFMVGMSSKGNEEKSAQGTQKTRHLLRQAFWEQALEALRKEGVTLFQNVSPSREHWISAGSGVGGCPFSLIFGKAEARVELVLQRPSAEESKLLFDELAKRKVEIETAFGAPLSWKRLDDKKSSRIEYAKPFDGYNQENWPEMIRWHVEHIRKFENAVRKPLQNVVALLRGKIGGLDETESAA
ncbi:MAG: DUF4268 domain-containing protein [Terricaulis sp.]